MGANSVQKAQKIFVELSNKIKFNFHLHIVLSNLVY